MFTLRRHDHRLLDRRRTREVRSTFRSRDGFGSLEVLDEDRLSPGGNVSGHPRRAAEILTYVREGALAYEDSMGRAGVLQAGEFLQMTAARGLRHSATNASRTEPAQVFQIWLTASAAGLAPVHEQRRFSTAQRRGELCVVASLDARRGSLRLHQDAAIYSSMLAPGQHVAYELAIGRSAWLHVVCGAVAADDVLLAPGDGLGVTGERALSFTACKATEILLLDLGPPRPRSPAH